jgi:VanZ family protein
LQSFDPERYSEIGDMVANTLGVTVAMILSRTRFRYMLMNFERYMHR